MISFIVVDFVAWFFDAANMVGKIFIVGEAHCFRLEVWACQDPANAAVLFRNDPHWTHILPHLRGHPWTQTSQSSPKTLYLATTLAAKHNAVSQCHASDATKAIVSLDQWVTELTFSKNTIEQGNRFMDKQFHRGFL